MPARFSIAAAVVVSALAVAAGAFGASSFPTSLQFTTAAETGTPNVLNFRGRVNSPKAACERNREVKFATAPAGSGGPYTPQGSDRSDSNGRFDEDVNVEGFPDVKISTAKKQIGPRGNRKTCKADAILVTAD